MTAPEAASFAQKVEELGYGALWIPEARGRNSVVHSGWLLSNTKSLVVATGIANIFGRDAQAALGGWHCLNEQSDGRFLLGLGVSHAPLVESVRGHQYKKPLATMREYLSKMREAAYDAPLPEKRGEVVIAALGPKMLELSAELSDGAHPYNVTPKHTAKAREIIGPDKRLYVEQKVLLENDAGRARSIARENLDIYLKLPNYRNNWLRLGFSEDEIDNAADRFLDAMVVWGDVNAIGRRLQEHWDAGADHVCVQPLGEKKYQPGMDVLEALAEKYLNKQ
jgi:probable F420-dependent oxidoreductase